MSLRGSSKRAHGNHVSTGQAALASTQRRSTQRPATQRRGYSLIELMIVVVITGVLAAVAIPAFRSYIMKGRTTEAINFLGVIKLRQEAYRAEFGAYAAQEASIDAIVFFPGGADEMLGGRTAGWDTTDPAFDPTFDAIGASPDSGTVRFGYGIVAGTPAQAGGGNGGTNLTAAPYNLPANQLDFYFISQAVADFDEDGTAMIFELTSFSRQMWSSDSGKGWD